MRCGVCEEQRRKGNKFCGECGSKLAAASSVPRTERRQITVLFYDLVGSTELSSASEPEDFREAILRFHQASSAAVKEFDAFVGAHVGDGGIIYFGYPVAREDAIECAIHAGLALTEAVSHLELPDGRMAQARVGIATGTGVVGRIEDGDTGNSAVGQVTSLAARLQTRARPGEVVIADRTKRLVGRLFDMDDLGYVEAKGFSDGVHAWKVLGRSALDRFSALHSTEIELIGREPETALLASLWDKACKDVGRICLVTGEPGVGKSRLAANFARQIDVEGALRINCFCTPHSRQAALRPFVSYLRRIAGADDWASQPSLEKFARNIAPGTPEVDRFLLGKLIGFYPEDPAEIEQFTSTQRRSETIAALVRQLEFASRLGPTVLLVEDIHWADPSSLELLEKVIEGADIGSTLVLMTGRLEAEDHWTGNPAIEFIRLHPFDTDNSRTLINHILGGTASHAMVDAITERAGGVALFIEELTKSILDADAYVRVEGAESFDLSEGFALPDTLQDSLLARLDQIGDGKRVAQVASVIGRDFDIETLRRIAPEIEDMIENGCAELCSAALVVPLDSEGGKFQFRHLLIQESANSTLVKQERRQYSGALLDMLEAVAAANEEVAQDPERWAHYAQEAGRPDRAVHYWLMAGLEALEQFATAEADARLRRGLERLKLVEDVRKRERLELDLRLTLGRVLLATKGHADVETGETFNRAGKLAEKVGDTHQRLAAMHGQQAHDLQLSRMRAAKNRSNTILALADQAKDDVWKLVGYRSRGIAGFPLGEYEQSASDLQAGLELLRKTDPLQVKRVVADDLEAAMSIYCSWSLIFLGKYSEGRELSDAALERALEMGQPYTIAFARVGSCYCRLLLRDFEGVDEHFAKSLSLCEEHEMWYFLYTLRLHHAHVRAIRGDPYAGGALHSGIVDYRKTGSILYQPTYMHWKALAHLEQGDDKTARETNDWAIKTAENYDMGHMFGEYYGLRAVLDHRAGRKEAASEAARQAFAWTDRQKAELSSKLNKELWKKHGIDAVALV